MSRLQVAGHTQIAHSQKRRTLTLVTISNIVLSKILHVMHIKAHVMSQPVRHEQAGNAAGNHLIHISAHEIQSLQLLEHILHGRAVHIPV